MDRKVVTTPSNRLSEFSLMKGSQNPTERLRARLKQRIAEFLNGNAQGATFTSLHFQNLREHLRQVLKTL